MTEDENDKSRIPIPFRRIPERYIERPYLKKDELTKIRDKLEELDEIKYKQNLKEPQVSKEIPKETQLETKNIEIKTNEGTNNITQNPIKQTDVIQQITNKLDDSTKEIKSKIPEIIHENKDIKLGISNIDNNQINKQTDNKQNSTVNINKTKKKVKRMSEEEGYVSPEYKKALLKSELDEIKKQERLLENSSEALRTANETHDKVKKLELKILDMSKEFEGTVDNKFKKIDSTINNFDSKFGQLDTKFNHVHEKLKETCTGIECLTKDLQKFGEKKEEFAECDDCHHPKVPYKSSYCPGCGKPLNWYEDDGVTPIKGFTPHWKKIKQ